jgi:hypothetical protein
MDEAKPFVVKDGIVLRATALQERNLEGEWDGHWQEIELSNRGQFAVQQAEENLKA